MATIEVKLQEDETGWSPYLSVEDACKLDELRDALQKKDLKLASKYGKVYELHPVIICNFKSCISLIMKCKSKN